MKISSFYKVNINKIVLFLLTILLAFSVSKAMFKIMAERTLGSIFRNFLPATPYLFLIVLFSLYDIRNISLSNFRDIVPTRTNLNANLKIVLFLSFFAVLIGVGTSQYVVDLGLLYVPVIIGVITALVFSCYSLLIERRLQGVIIFLVVIPFTFFLQMNLRQIIPQLSDEGFKIFEIQIPLSSIFLFIMSIVFFIGYYKSAYSDIRNEGKRFIKLCIIFVSMPIFSIIFSKEISHSFIYYLLDIALPFVYFLIVMRSLKNTEDIRIFIFALIISIFLYQFFNLYFMSQQGTVEDISTGLYGSQISTGFSYTLIPLLIPFQVAMYKLSKGWGKKIVGFILIIFIVYLFLSNYRTAILSSFTGFLIFYFFYYRISLARKLALVSVCLLCMTMFFLYSNTLTEKLSFFRIFETFQQVSSGESLDDLSSSRISIWHAALNMIFDHPFLGIGPDMWSQYIPQYSRTHYFYRDIYRNLVRYYEYDPHNLYLLIWINYGVINFICYLLLVYNVLKKGIRNIKKSPSNFLRIISIAAYISFINWVFMSFFTIRFFNHSEILYALIFWSIIAVIFKINEFNSIQAV